MTREKLFSITKEVIVDAGGLNDKEVVEGANFTDDLGLDSLDSVEIAIDLEERLGRYIPNLELSTEDMGSAHTVGQLVDLLERKLKTYEATVQH